MKKYKQCRLTAEDMQLTSWVDSEHAKVGKQIQFKGVDEWWTVAEVFGNVELSGDQLKEMQALNRNSLPSVEGMR